MTRQGLLKQIQRRNEPLKNIVELEKKNEELKDSLDYEKSISDQKQNEINLKYREVIALQEHIEKLEKEKCELLGIIQGKDKAIADLKKGLKWHKVADGDLPPEDTDVLALLADNKIYMAHFYRRNVWDKIGPVIAWCEIPQYTEE